MGVNYFGKLRGRGGGLGGLIQGGGNASTMGGGAGVHVLENWSGTVRVGDPVVHTNAENR